MLRRRKRLWTALIAGVSTALVIFALAVGAVRIFDRVSPGYRTQLAEKVAALAERPVRIGRLDLEWRGLHPALVLGDLQILTQNRRALIFSMKELSVGISWLALFRGEFRPADIELRGLTLGLEWRGDGRLGIRDIDGGELVIDFAEVARWTERIDSIRLRDSTLEWLEPGAAQPQLIQAVQAELRHSGQRYRLKGSAELPLGWGQALSFDLAGEGDLAQFESMVLQGKARVAALRPQPWLAPYLRRTLNVEGAALDAEAAIVLRGMQLQTLTLNFQGKPGIVLRKKTSELLGTLPGPNGELALRTVAEGWDVEIRKLGYGNGVQTQGQVHYREDGEQGNVSLKLMLDRLDCAALLSWLSILQPTAAAKLPVSGAGGELRNLRLDWQQSGDQPGRYTVESGLHEVTLPATGERPGFSHLSGQLRADSQSGELRLDTTGGAAEIPAVFKQPLALSRLTGVVAWQQGSEGLKVSGRDLALQVRSLDTKTGFELLIPADGSSPTMDLAGDFQGNALDAKPYIPLPPALGADVGQWLDRSIQGGQARNGRVELKGKLGDFPYTTPDKPGHFRVAIDAADATLDYGPGWPPLTQINGHIEIDGKSIHIEAPTARMLDAAVGPAVVSIDEFLHPVLIVDGKANTGIATQLRFLGESPLQRQYGPLLKALTGEGPSDLSLHLELPLSKIDDFKVDGQVQLQGVALRYGGLNAPITQVKGPLNFSRSGLHADALEGQLLGLPFAARLSPAEGGVRLEADMGITLPQDTAALSPLVPSAWLQPLHGSSRWQLAGEIRLDGSPAEFKLLSDLVGLEMQYGAPLSKPADQALPTELSYSPRKQGFEIGARLGQVGHARMQFLPKAAGTVLERGAVQFGDAARVELPAQPGLWLTGKLASLDVDALSKSLLQVSRDTPATTGDSLLRGGEVAVSALKAGGATFRESVFKLSPTVQGWRVQLQGPDTQGQIDWNRAGRGSIEADFERLVLNFPQSVEPEAPTTGEVKTKEPPADPGKWPALRFRAKQLGLGSFIVGEAKVEVPAIANGIRVQEVQIVGPRTSITASGEWVRPKEGSSARLLVNINGNAFKELLAGIGFAPNVTTEQADVFIDAAWLPHPDGLANRTLNGQVKFDLRKGALLNVDPGAGRILSLLSFNALPRRLLLDFSDVLDKGTQFDTLQGAFFIKNGVAHTDDLRVKSSSVNIAVKGDVDFVQRRYDQQVTIKPKVSSGVALAGAVMAGPVVGLALLLGQSVLDQPLDSISTITYRLQGPFKNPDVQQVEVKKRKPPSVKPAAAPRKSAPAPSTPKPAPRTP